jgi:glycosyltransferase involved in cell wall biosynthesis
MKRNLIINVFPNNSIIQFKGKLYLEKSHEILFTKLLNQEIALRLVAVREEASDLASYSAISEICDETIKFCCIGDGNRSSGKWSKFIRYFKQIPAVAMVTIKANLNYIYFPGHTALLALVVCFSINKPYAIYLRGDVSTIYPSISFKFFLALFRRAKFILTISEAEADSLVNLGCNALAITPLSLLLQQQIKRTDKIHKKSEEMLSMLFVGRVAKEKGIIDLIYAVKNLHYHNYTNFEIKIVGAGGELERCIELVNELGITKLIQFEGNISSTDLLGKFFQRAEVFILPTYHEGYPRVLWEAMSFSLAVVTTPVGQIPSVITDRYNGLFVKPGDIQALSASLEMLITSSKLRNQLGKNGYATWANARVRFRKNGDHGAQVIDQLRLMDYLT